MYVHHCIVFILTTIFLSLQTSVIIALTQKSTFTFLSYTFTLMKVTLPTPLMIVLRQTNSPTFTGSRANSVKQQKLSDWTSTLRHPETPLSSQMSQMSSLSRLQNKKGFIKIPAFTGFANKLGQPESEFVPKSEIRPNFRPKDCDTIYQLHIC